jgi:hypothetical protein
MKGVCFFMKKRFIAVLIMILPAFLMATQARNIEILDVPTANTLMKGEIRGDFKFYPGGGILSRLYVGIFDRLMIGGAERLDNIISSADISAHIPWFLAKVRITDDDGGMPAISLGYEGETYYNIPRSKGLYLAATKEIEMGPIFAQLTGTLYNNNEFSRFGNDMDAGAGIEFAITKEFVVGTEIDGIFGALHRNINATIGYFFDPIELDLGMQYGLWHNDYFFSRILRIVYIAYF